MIAAKRPTKDQIRSAATQRKAERLDYIRQMLRELREMTEAEEELFITYLIGMAYVATSDLFHERYANLVTDIHPIKGADNGSTYQETLARCGTVDPEGASLISKRDNSGADPSRIRVLRIRMK
jgi:hypothetical protein